jgi:hypothetical protein
MSRATTNRTCRITRPPHLTMDAYVDFLAASLPGVNAAKADRLKRIQKDIRVPFSFTPTPKRMMHST